jgi:hypothetical protein
MKILPLGDTIRVGVRSVKARRSGVLASPVPRFNLANHFEGVSTSTTETAHGCSSKKSFPFPGVDREYQRIEKVEADFSTQRRR